MKQIAKALLILILSVWASAENNLLSASNSPRSSVIKRVEALQHRPRHERPQFKNPIMNDKDFQYLYKVIKKKAFEKEWRVFSREYLHTCKTDKAYTTTLFGFVNID